MLSSLTLRWLFGGGFLALGMIGSAWCARRLDEAGEDRGILTPTRQVVTDGPYRWSRNPDSLSVTLSYIGLALLLDNVWMLVYLAPVLVLVHYGVILREERYLERKFGEEYCDYKSRVRRWL
jgi:protein-S-isoprenylcysteine O-methyltransferase Ste14